MWDVEQLLHDGTVLFRPQHSTSISSIAFEVLVSILFALFVTPFSSVHRGHECTVFLRLRETLFCYRVGRESHCTSIVSQSKQLLRFSARSANSDLREIDGLVQQRS
jgi:hypothetical protein